MTDLSAKVFVRAAERHGEDTGEGIEMALGDLEIYLAAAFSVMGPEQRRAFLLHPEVSACLGNAFGEDAEVAGFAECRALYEKVAQEVERDAAMSPGH